MRYLKYILFFVVVSSYSQVQTVDKIYIRELLYLNEQTVDTITEGDTLATTQHVSDNYIPLSPDTIGIGDSLRLDDTWFDASDLSGGGGTIGGSIAINQIVVGTGTNTIGGDTNLVKDNFNLDDNYNVLLGYRALNNSDDATPNDQYNIGIGMKSLYSQESGDYNISIGHETMYSADEATYNIAIGKSALYNTEATGSIAIGEEALYTNVTSAYNTAIGYRALYLNNGGEYNIALGYTALYNVTTGVNNIAIGRGSGQYITTQSNRLFIDPYQARSDLANDTTKALIYGIAAAATENQKLDFNSHVNISESITVNDSSDIITAATKWHRQDTINSPVADGWRNVKFDTNIVAETTYGIDILSDSTGFEFTTSGLFKVEGCGHWVHSGTGTDFIYIRGTVDGTEKRCMQASDSRTFFSGNNGALPYSGTIRAIPGTVLRIQYRVTDTNLDFEGDAVFDNPIAFSVNITKISK